MVADVWDKDVWEFQAKSGSSGSCGLFLHFLGKIAVQEMSGKTPGLSGLKNAKTQNAAFFERKGPKRKPWPRGKSLSVQKNDRNAFFER